MKRTIRLIESNLEEENLLGQETPDETAAKIDGASKGLYPVDKIKNQEVLDQALEEDADTGKDLENDTVEEVVDDIQDETAAEEEENNSTLDVQLVELREVLPDLDLNLYQVISKEDSNNIFYFIGKVAEDSDDVLMLVDTDIDEDEVKIADTEELPDDNVEEIENDKDYTDKFDLVKIPNTFEEFTKLSPRYGDELTPNHEEILNYLMQLLVEENPQRAEEISEDKVKVDVNDGGDLEDEENY